MWDGCFGIGSDHEADAFDDYVAREENWGEDDAFGHPPRRKRRPKVYRNAKPDPLYHHTKILFSDIVSETEKCWLFSFEGGVQKWVPKSICRKLDRDACSVFVHRVVYSKIKPVAKQTMQTRKEAQTNELDGGSPTHDELMQDWLESQTAEWEQEMEDRYDRSE